MVRAEEVRVALEGRGTTGAAGRKREGGRWWQEGGDEGEGGERVRF